MLVLLEKLLQVLPIEGEEEENSDLVNLHCIHVVGNGRLFQVDFVFDDCAKYLIL